MNDKKDQAFALRNKLFSYSEINRRLGIPKSTLSYWFRNYSASKKVKRILIIKSQNQAIPRLRALSYMNKLRWKKIHERTRQSARVEYSKLARKSLFFFGLALYWGEGDKKIDNSIVRLSNSDPELLRAFVIFLLHICMVSPDKIKAWLLYYPDLDEMKCKDFWGNKLNIPLSRFLASQLVRGKKRREQLSHGVCTVQVCSRELKEKIFEWIRMYNSNLNAGIV